MFYVYILQCGDNTFYTGYTVNIEKRVENHNAGLASKYTRSRLPVRCVYTEECSSKSEALKREREIKALTRKQKQALINGY
mgnify:CR=1 FL=1|jgi:putative endonuclease